MSCLVTDADIAVLERQRQERIIRAQRARAPRRLEDGADVPAYVRRDARQGLLAFLADIRDTSRNEEIESADPLGVWSSGAPRQPRRRPAWGAVADWVVWSGLCLLAILYEATR